MNLEKKRNLIHVTDVTGTCCLREAGKDAGTYAAMNQVQAWDDEKESLFCLKDNDVK